MFYLIRVREALPKLTSLRLPCDFIHANCLMVAKADFGTGFGEVDIELAKMGVAGKRVDG